MPFVTALFVPTTTGGDALVIQMAGEIRLVVDSKAKPAALVGQFKMTLVPEGLMVNSGGLTGNVTVRLNTVPLPVLPPEPAVP
jgi:hypothetical protein